MSLFNAEHFSQAVPLSFNTNVTDGAIMIVMDCTRCVRLSAVSADNRTQRVRFTGYSQDKGMYFLKGLIIRHGFDVLSRKAEKLETVDYSSLLIHLFILCQSFVCFQMEFLR